MTVKNKKNAKPRKPRQTMNSLIMVAGFCANDMDFHKFEITGVQIDRPSVFDVQPWAEAEMGENESVKQGWRVGLKRAAMCVLDFEMDNLADLVSSGGCHPPFTGCL